MSEEAKCGWKEVRGEDMGEMREACGGGKVGLWRVGRCSGLGASRLEAVEKRFWRSAGERMRERRWSGGSLGGWGVGAGERSAGTLVGRAGVLGEGETALVMMGRPGLGGGLGGRSSFAIVEGGGGRRDQLRGIGEWKDRQRWRRVRRGEKEDVKESCGERREGQRFDGAGLGDLR